MKKLVILLILLVLPTIVAAGEISKESLDRFMQLSGLNEQISQVPGMVQAGIQQAHTQSPNLPEPLFNAIMKSVETAFEPGWFKLYVTNQLKIDASESDLKENIAWYESALGKKITAAEVKGSSPEAYQEMLQNAGTLMADADRVAIAKKIDALAHASESSLKLQEKTAITIYTAMMTAFAPGQPVNVEAFKAQMAGQMEQMRAQSEAGTLLSFLYCYQGLAPEEMDAYIHFLESSPAQRMNNSIRKGLMFAFDTSIKNMAKNLTEILKPPQG